VDFPVELYGAIAVINDSKAKNEGTEAWIISDANGMRICQIVYSHEKYQVENPIDFSYLKLGNGNFIAEERLQWAIGTMAWRQHIWRSSFPGWDKTREASGVKIAGTGWV
jgi:hypothetical protein